MIETFRPRSNFVWAGASFALILLFAANSLFIVNNPVQTSVELTLCVVLVVLTHVMWIRPKLVLTNEAIKVVNPLRTLLIPYSEVLELKTKWTLTIVHRRGSIRVWVAPASGKRRWIADKTFGWYGSGVPMSGSADSGFEPMSFSLNSSSGQAAYLIRERLKRFH
jgi:hypothetical protein